MSQKSRRLRYGGLFGALLALFTVVIVATPALADDSNITPVPEGGYTINGDSGTPITNAQINGIVDNGFKDITGTLDGAGTIGWASGSPTANGGTINITITDPNVNLGTVNSYTELGLGLAFDVPGYPIKDVKLLSSTFAGQSNITNVSFVPYNKNDYTDDGSTDLPKDFENFFNAAFKNLDQTGDVSQLVTYGTGNNSIQIQLIGRGATYKDTNTTGPTYTINFVQGWETKPTPEPEPVPLPEPTGNGSPAAIENQVTESISQVQEDSQGIATVNVSGTTIAVEIVDEDVSTDTISSTVVSGIVGAARMAGATVATSVQNPQVTLELPNATQGALDDFTAQCVAAAVPLSSQPLAVDDMASSLANMTCGINVKAADNSVITYTFNFYGNGEAAEPVVAVTRLYNPTTGAHLLTTDQNEIKTLTARGWTTEKIAGNNESTAFYMYAGATTDGKPNVVVHRLFNPETGEHLYTRFPSEVENLTKNHGWTIDNLVFYAPATSNAPVYRLFNPNATSPLASHLFTSDANEVATLTSLTGNMRWVKEGEGGIGFYAVYGQYGPSQASAS